MAKQINSDYIVIGSGIAGLTVARELSAYGSVTVITKSRIRESATEYAQGGIAAALREDDAPKYHYEDTINAGAGLCNEEAVKILVENGPRRVQELIDLGANFDKSEKGDYHFTREAAHGRRRILHAGDATGREIEKTLGNAILREEKVNFHPNTTVTDLIIEKDACLGCWAIKDGETIQYTARATILTTGGCGQLFAHTTNPPVATGDGLALALKAGTSLKDMAFIQFHPTTLYTGDKKPISIFLITEAVRGEGAILRNIHGTRFMPSYHPDAELAPRDTVARAIFDECKRTQSPHVYLDLSQLDMDIQKRFPTIYQRCLEAKIDITRDFIPVAPAAHYCMGGVETDVWGRTSINRLYAGGEVACSGVHGANRLASNSLLDGLVFGYRIAEDVGKTWKDMPDISMTDSTLRSDESISQETVSQCLMIKQDLRDLMWREVGIKRHEKGLRRALAQIDSWKWIDEIQTNRQEILEVQNMRQVAHVIATEALSRKESCGSHFREDVKTTRF